MDLKLLAELARLIEASNSMSFEDALMGITAQLDDVINGSLISFVDEYCDENQEVTKDFKKEINKFLNSFAKFSITIKKTMK